MSDLATFRDHAARMATAYHKPECRFTRLDPSHRCGGGCTHRRQCPGCVTDADRTLWQRLADEVDAYLTTDAAEGLFA
jgi:hypothetical protein